MSAPADGTGPQWDILDSWVWHLEVTGKRPMTIRSYRGGVRAFRRFLGADLLTATRSDAERFAAHLRANHRQNTASIYLRACRAFYAWLVEEEEIAVSPFKRVKAPGPDAPPVEVLDATQLRKLMAATQGKDFLSRRDALLLAILIDTGCRANEAATLRLQDVDLHNGLLSIDGKGGKPRVVSMGNTTRLALSRYLRVRPDCGQPWLLLTRRNTPMARTEIHRVVQRIGRRAGVKVHPHQLRHTFAHHWLANGGQEGDLMRLAGWSSRAMILRYGATEAQNRAISAHKALSPADRLL